MLTWITGSRHLNLRLAMPHLLRLQVEVMVGDPQSQTTHLSLLQRDLDTAETTATHLHPSLPQALVTATWVTC